MEIKKIDITSDPVQVQGYLTTFENERKKGIRKFLLQETIFLVVAIPSFLVLLYLCRTSIGPDMTPYIWLLLGFLIISLACFLANMIEISKPIYKVSLRQITTVKKFKERYLVNESNKEELKLFKDEIDRWESLLSAYAKVPELQSSFPNIISKHLDAKKQDYNDFEEDIKKETSEIEKINAELDALEQIKFPTFWSYLFSGEWKCT